MDRLICMYIYICIVHCSSGCRNYHIEMEKTLVSYKVLFISTNSIHFILAFSFSHQMHDHTSFHVQAHVGFTHRWNWLRTMWSFAPVALQKLPTWS